MLFASGMDVNYGFTSRTIVITGFTIETASTATMAVDFNIGGLQHKRVNNRNNLLAIWLRCHTTYIVFEGLSRCLIGDQSEVLTVVIPAFKPSAVAVSLIFPGFPAWPRTITMQSPLNALRSWD